MLDAANVRRKACVDSLRREKMAETMAKRQLKAELESSRNTCSSTTRLTQQVRWLTARAPSKDHFEYFPTGNQVSPPTSGGSGSGSSGGSTDNPPGEVCQQ